MSINLTVPDIGDFEKVEIIEMDETPTFGIETVIKLGIAGVVECKQ